jgi:hypothetical protein
MDRLRLLSVSLVACAISCTIPAQEGAVQEEPGFSAEAVRNRLAPFSLAIEGGGTVPRANVYWDRLLKTTCEFSTAADGIRCLPVHALLGRVAFALPDADARPWATQGYADPNCKIPAVSTNTPEPLGDLRYAYEYDTGSWYEFDPTAPRVPLYEIINHADRGPVCEARGDRGWPRGRLVPVTIFARFQRTVVPS